jgi:hypothetical protein
VLLTLLGVPRMDLQGPTVTLISPFGDLPGGFHIVCTMSCSRQRCVRALIIPRPCQHLLLSVFLITAVLPSGCEVASHCGFDLHFLRADGVRVFSLLTGCLCGSWLVL